MNAAAAGGLTEGMSQQEVLEKSLPIMKLCATDKAFPDWTPRLQSVIEEATTDGALTALGTYVVLVV